MSRITLPKGFGAGTKLARTSRGTSPQVGSGRGALSAANLANAARTKRGSGGGSGGLALTGFVFSPVASNLLAGNQISTLAKKGLVDAADGTLMSKAEANALKTAAASGKLNAEQQATILQALSSNQQLQQAQANAAANTGGSSGSGGSGIGGSGSGTKPPYNGGGSIGSGGGIGVVGVSGGGRPGGGVIVNGGGGFAPGADGVALAPAGLEEGVAMPPAVAALGTQEQVFGCQITELNPDGAAKKDGLLVGDVILAVGNQPTADFEAIRVALQSAGGEVEVIFLNKENGEVERIVLHPQESLIGATVEGVQVR